MVHERLESANFVYMSWHDAATKLHPRGTSAIATFVYDPWLRVGGSVDLIRSSMADWLTTNPDHEQIDFLIKAWLEATSDFEAIRSPALLWFKRNRTNLNAVF